MQTFIFSRKWDQTWLDSPDSHRYFKDPRMAVMRLQLIRAAGKMSINEFQMHLVGDWHSPYFRRYSAGQGSEAGFGENSDYIRHERSVGVLKRLYREERTRRQAAFEASLIPSGHMLNVEDGPNIYGCGTGEETVAYYRMED
jgi:hypothetical protein